MVFAMRMATFACAQAFLSPTASVLFTATTRAVKTARDPAARGQNDDPQHDGHENARKLPAKLKGHPCNASQAYTFWISLVVVSCNNYGLAAVVSTVLRSAFALCRPVF